LSAAHSLLQEAADTLSEDEIRKMKELTIRNRELQDALNNRGNQSSSVNIDLGPEHGRGSPGIGMHNQYHTIITGTPIYNITSVIRLSG